MAKTTPAILQAEVLPDYFSRAMRLTWQLRSDVREGLQMGAETPEEAHQTFCAWWLIFGRTDFPLHAVPEAVGRIAQEPAGTREGQPMTRLMRLLWASAPEHAKGAQEFLAWYYLFGVTRYRLYDWISDQERRFLHQRAPELIQDAPIGLTRLMGWVHAVRPDVQGAFPLAEASGRQGYAAWFVLHGLEEHALFPYYSLEEVVSWLKPARLSDLPQGTPVSVLMQLASIGEFKDDPALSITAPGGPEKLAEATRRLMAPGGPLAPIRALLHGLSVRHASQPLIPLAPSARRQGLKACITEAPFGVNLVGYALGELGIGEDVRMLAKALEAAGVPFSILNRQPGPQIREMDFSAATHLSSETPYPITIIAMTGFDTAHLWLDRPDLFESAYVIGYWPWELPEWPRSWNEAYELVDEVWASTRYTQAAYLKSAPVPVHHVPMAVEIPKASDKVRADFGLDPKRFWFLYMFDFMSYPARKNPEGAIRAFEAAFPKGDERVGLILKVSNRDASDPRWVPLQRRVARDPRIMLLDETLDRDDLMALIKSADAYLSLHRAEGFGRTLAEALLLKKPVIATDYSGNTDYLDEHTGYPVACEFIPLKPGDYPFGEGQMWAEPIPEAAADALKQVVTDPLTARRKAQAGQKRIRDIHGAGTVGRQVKARLEAVLATLQSGTSPKSPRHLATPVQRKHTA